MLCILGFVALIISGGVFAWDPDAGLVKSWTKYPGVTVDTTSNAGEASKVLDSNEKTNWQSGACAPTGFLDRPELNTLLHACADKPNRCTSTGSVKLAPATDGSFSTGANIPFVNGIAKFEVQLRNAGLLLKVAIKGNYKAETHLEALTNQGLVSIATVGPEVKYHFLVFEGTNLTVSALRVRSSDAFTVIELAVLASPCYEMAAVDLGTPREVQVVQTRHWAGGRAIATSLLVSTNGNNWTEVARLNPDALRTVTTRLDQPITVRHVAVRHEVKEGNWNKVYVWEIDAYDQFGRWGHPPVPKKHSRTVADILGVNGIWGWGTNKYSKNLPHGQGPDRYSPVATHARNYHNLNWDVRDPDHIPDYNKMAQGGGTEAQWWLNWDTEYGNWKLRNLIVHVTMQFTNRMFKASAWNNPRLAGEGIGRAFSQHFGPTNGNGFVSAFEVGNEPWDYSADFYKQVLSGMASAAKSADSNMTVLPCALQAHDPTTETSHSGNYIGSRIDQNMTSYLDVINCHFYSFLTQKDGRRITVYPEHPDSEFNGVRNILRWRDLNTPGKDVWVTEWGWDSDGAGEACKASECVSEHAQALYGVRGLLILIRMGVQQATWFFYANDAKCDNIVFCRSGLTGSSVTGFKEKKVFRALRATREIVGDKHFVSVVREDGAAHVYSFGDKHGCVSHLVAWKPVSAEDTTTSTITFNPGLAAAPRRAWSINGISPTGDPTTLPRVASGVWAMSISSIPIIVEV